MKTFGIIRLLQIRVLSCYETSVPLVPHNKKQYQPMDGSANRLTDRPEHIYIAPYRM